MTASGDVQITYILWPIIFTVLDTLGISSRFSGSPTLHNSYFEIRYLLGLVVCRGPVNIPALGIFSMERSSVLIGGEFLTFVILR